MNVWYAIFGIICMSALGYFDIPISAKILGVFLITELFIIFAFTIGVFIQGGNDGVSIDPVLPWNAFKGFAFGLGIFIAKTLLERSGARLKFENQPLTGSARVEIVWPRESIEFLGGASSF